MRRTCRTRKSDLSVPIRLAGDTRAQDRLEDDGGRQLSPKVMLPGAAGADRACTGGRARHDLRWLRQEGRDEETSLLLPSVAVPAPGCSGPPTGPPPPALLQCTPVGGRSGPAAARSRPAMLTETKKKASGAREPNSRAQRGNEREGFATIVCSGMMTDVGGVCGRTEIAVARWYYHLLVLHLVFLLLLCIILFSNRTLLVLALVSPYACVLPTHTYACSSYGSYFMPVRLLNISRESYGPNVSGS